MKYFTVVIVFLISTATLVTDVNAQHTERKLPDSFKGLIYGGRFMDRFLPAPIHEGLETDIWGADNVIPRDIHNGIEDPQWSYWGGNPLLGPDGRYHLFVCRWREDSERGHWESLRSHVVHAMSEKPTGPFVAREQIGPGHNPEIFQLKDGRYVIYVMVSYYISDSLDGPWKASKFEFNYRGRRDVEGLSNLTFTQREDGSVLMICRGGGVWISKDGLAPYNRISEASVYPRVAGNFEDPVVWKTEIQYHLIVNDWRGRIAYYLRSKDGVHWKNDPGEAYSTGFDRYEDGTKVDWYKYERIKILQDQYGRATHAYFAVIDVPKKDDKGSDNHSSKNIALPLVVGRRLEILNKDKITPDTKTISLKIKAEKGFNPHTDVNMDSLLLGAPEKVNYGNGCKAIKSEKSGKNLIVTFDAKDHGFTDDNFAAKLIGKDSKGKLLFGFARLPWVSYSDPILSPDPIKVTNQGDNFQFSITVRNFGLTASKKNILKLAYKKNSKSHTIGQSQIAALEPYGQTTTHLRCAANKLDLDEGMNVEVIINPNSQHPEIIRRENLILSR